MILFTVLLLILLILTIVMVLATSIVGAGAIILFGDLIICIAFIGWLIYKLIRRRK